MFMNVAYLNNSTSTVFNFIVATPVMSLTKR